MNVPFKSQVGQRNCIIPLETSTKKKSLNVEEKRENNRKAAKKCRDNKRVRENIEKQQTQEKIDDLEKKIVQMNQEIIELSRMKYQWSQTETALLNALKRLRIEYKSQKEYISQMHEKMSQSQPQPEMITPFYFDNNDEQIMSQTYEPPNQYKFQQSEQQQISQMSFMPQISKCKVYQDQAEEKLSGQYLNNPSDFLQFQLDM